MNFINNIFQKKSWIVEKYTNALKLKMTDKDNVFVLQGAVGLDGPNGDQVSFKNLLI